MNVERLAAIADRPFVDGIAGTGLVIVDDYFPNLLTGFRVAEFNHYLRMFPGLKIAYTTPGFRIHYEAYAARYPELADRVVPWDSTSLNGAKAVYFVFLNNAHHWVAEVERRGLPFGFTLYPGGGFHLQDEATRVALSRVLNSPMIRGVIATQPITLDILRQHHCRAPVSYIPGVAVSPAYLDLHRISPVETSGDELRICFAAFKYEARGVSKGYPEFLQAAGAIAARYPQTVFSVAGNFDANDEPIPPSLSGRLTFVGPLATVELREFLLGQDIMVAPSRRFAVTGREFDGFPTGTCIEAALCGVALICSDELDQNRHYDPGNDLIICPPDVSALIRSMDELVRDPARLLTLRENGRQRTKELYAPEAQLIPRTRFLRRLALDVGIPI